MKSLKKILALVLIIILFNYSIVSSKEPTSYFKLPKVYKQSLNTKLEGNNYLYPVEIDGQYGFININGKLVIEPKFVLYMVIDKGYYLAYTEDENYVKDTNSYNDNINETYLIMPNSTIIKISDGRVYAMITENKKYALINKGSYEYDKYVSESFILDLQKKKKIDESNETYEIISAYDDCYIVKSSNLYYMKGYDKKNLSAGYESFVEEREGTYFFQGDDKLYFLDKTGTPYFTYEKCIFGLPFYKGVASVIDKDGNLKFVDKDKNVLHTYANAYSIFKQDNFYIANLRDKILLLGYDGSNKLSDDYGGEISYFFGDGQTISAYDENTYVLDIFDEDGNIRYSYTIPKEYNNPRLIGEYILLMKDKAYGLGTIKDGKIIWLLQPEYSSIYTFDPYIMVSSSDFMNVGIYDLTIKKFIVELKYRSVYVYDKNMIYVKSAYFDGYVNSKGQFVYVRQSYGLSGD